MNKYIKILLMMFLVCFMYIGNVKAEDKEIKFICTYNYEYDTNMVDYEAVKETLGRSSNCYFYSDATVECKTNETSVTDTDDAAFYSPLYQTIIPKINSSTYSEQGTCPKKITVMKTQEIGYDQSVGMNLEKAKYYIYLIDRASDDDELIASDREGKTYTDTQPSPLFISGSYAANAPHTIPTTSNSSYEPRDVKCPLGPNVTKDLYGLLNILKIAAPILVIVLSVVDAIKALVKDDSKAELKKVAIRFGKRAVFAVILFFLPVLVNQVMIMANIWDENGTCDLSNPQENEATSSNDKDTNTDNKPCNSLSIQDCSSNKQCTQYENKCVYKCKYLSSLTACANNSERCTIVNDKKCANK